VTNLRVLVAAVVVMGCGAEAQPAATVTIPAPAPAPASRSAAVEPAPRASARPAAAQPAADGPVDAVGVPECDAYIDRLGRCIKNGSPAAWEAWHKTTGSMVEAWHKAASSPEGRSLLTEGCRAALDALAANPMCK
jgi:hypothetical protein